MPEEPLSYSSIVKAMSRIEHQIHRTPVMTSSLIDAAAKKSVFFKCEHLQIAGSFKTRGALNSVR
jgi:threonine dehydratase